jgi:tyrosine-specific transport protein
MGKYKRFNAIMMIVSTTVGVGILGLPIVTSESGLIPTLFAFCLAWGFMTVAAYYILEVKMQVKGHYSLSSMIKLTLGPVGHYVSSGIILLLLYALLSTYMMAGGAWVNLVVTPNVPLPAPFIMLLFTGLFLLILLGSERVLYNVNNGLGVLVFGAFMITVFSSLIPSQHAFIKSMQWTSLMPSLPLLLTTFGFSIVVPAVTEYLAYDEKAVKQAILVGSLVSLMAYLTWEWVALGNIPITGLGGLQQLKEIGDNGTGVIQALSISTGHAWVIFSGRLFAFFLVVTSFLALSLALLHFLLDALHLSSTWKNRLLLGLLMYIPPGMVTYFYPKAFVQILSVAGIFVALLLGLFPALMVFKTRQLSLRSLNKKAIVMSCVGLFFCFVIAQELINLIG